MFGRKTEKYAFTDRLRHVFTLSREEAIRLGHPYIGTEHLLLGLLRDTGGVAGAVLHHLKVDFVALRNTIEQTVRPAGPVPASASGPLPYTSRAKKALDLAAEEARELNHSYVGTEHLLLGLLREANGIAAQVLFDVDVTTEDARAETIRLLGARASVAESPIQFEFRIDDDSDRSIFEQIIVQLQEGVATMRLRAGDRLPSVRQLADELDIAPGTVARAYGELERRGIVVTDGARGTRIADRRRPAAPVEERPETLLAMMRPVVVAGFHLGASAPELRQALDEAMRGIYGKDSPNAA